MNKKNISIFICIIILISTFSINVISSKSFEDDKLVLIRIYTNDIISSRDFEIISVNPGEWIDVIITKKNLNELSNHYFSYVILIEDIKEYDNNIRGEYHTLNEIETILNNIADNYPEITNLYSIGITYEGRDIWCLEITDKPGEDEGEPGVFFMGLHHAREWPTVEICLNIANELTSKYGSDPAITDVVNNVRLWLVSCVNPDGYYYCHDQGYDWRKNRQPYPPYIGVDLNRNYAGSSDGNSWGSWGSVGTGSISNHPSSEVFCGPWPLSEYETQAVKNIFLNNNICAAISWHTHGELVMWPWGYTSSSAPDSTYLLQIGQQIASRITRQSGSGSYNPTQAYGLYPTTGDTIDWAYGYSHYVQGRPTFAYTIEACASYHPPESYLNQIIAENFEGGFYLLEEAKNIQNTVVPRVLPPVIDEMDEDDDGDYIVSWVEQNPNADPIYFQLDELSDLSIFTDNAESGSNNWIIEGFIISSNRFHSSSHSFKSRDKNNDVSSMVSINPIPISADMKFSFWCWYNIESQYDYAFVEVSRDGRYFEVLDSFTGSSGGWTYKEYNLDDYIGESIFLRIRYITDDYMLEEGFYIDDISPISEFGTINTLSDTITEDYYEIINQEEGTYYYRIGGYNSEHEWGDFSTVEEIIVEYIGAPRKPTIDGPIKGIPDVKYDYIFLTTDPEDEDVFYYIDWGDGQTEEWIGPYASGKEVIKNHTWNSQGTYTIKAKAKDINGLESDWGVLEIKIPKSRLFSISFLQKIMRKNLEILTIFVNLSNIV